MLKNSDRKESREYIGICDISWIVLLHQYTVLFKERLFDVSPLEVIFVTATWQSVVQRNEAKSPGGCMQGNIYL